MGEKRLTDEQLEDLIGHFERESPGSDVGKALRELKAARAEIAELEGLIEDMDLQIEDMHDQMDEEREAKFNE